jgi:glycosyltransferase involved in cell wall biosynthesis
MIKVSILIPTFNRAKRLKKAIESGLSQDYENLEIVVSDNNSTDNTYEIITEFLEDKRFKYYKNNTNIGMVNNWKKGIFELISGDYFIILNDDDYLIKNDYISKAVKIIEENKDISLVQSYGYHCEKNNAKKVELPFLEVEDGKIVFMQLFKRKHITSNVSNILFNRKLVMKSNSLSNKYNLCTDMEMFLKLCLFGKVGLVKEFSSVYNIHHQNLMKKIDYNYIVNVVDYIINPYRCALKYNKLSKAENIYWESIIFRMFRNCLFNVKYHFPEKYDETIKILKVKDEKILNQVLNDKIYKILKFSDTLHFFRIIYKIRDFIRELHLSF